MKKILLSILALFLFSSNVYATSLTAVKDDAWTIGEVMKVEDGEETTTHLRRLYLDTDTPAFCVDYGAHIQTGTVTVNQVDLISYFSRGISESSAQALKKRLSEYLYFGYGYEGRTSEKYYFATQKLIWDAINDSGFYRSSDYTSRVGETNFSTIGFKIKDGETINISAELGTITDSISAYYKTPSVCSSQKKYELAVGESMSFTDNNNVIANYNVECDAGLTCEVNGGTLTVTATEAGKGKTIRFSKAGAGVEPVLYENPTPDPEKPDKENQNVISGGNVGPVSCSFSIDTYQNVQTGSILKAVIITLGFVLAVVVSIICIKGIKINKAPKDEA